MPKYDEIDLHILTLLQDDARMSNAAIAEQVGLTASTVFERVKKLERRGAVRKYVALVDPAALGKPITAFVRLMMGGVTGDAYQEMIDDFMAQCLQETAVLECHSVAGEDCFVLKVRVATTQALESLLRRLRAYGPVLRSTTSIVLSTTKESTKVVPAESA